MKVSTPGAKPAPAPFANGKKGHHSASHRRFGRGHAPGDPARARNWRAIFSESL